MARNFLPSVTSVNKGNLYGYYLPKGLLTLQIYRKGEHFFLDVKQTHILPDPQHHYFLEYVPNGFWADDITVEFGPHGFLRRIHTKVEDQLDDVIDKALGVLTGLVQIGAGIIPGGQKGRSASDQPVLVFTGTIDPFDPEHLALVNRHLEDHGSEENPVTFTAKALGRTEYAVTADTKVQPAQTKERTLTSGVWVKPRALCEVSVEYPNGKSSRQVELPHPNLIEFVEIPVARFVKSEFELKFDEQGYPSSIYINKPSSFVAFFELLLMPVNALISLPAKIFKFRIDIDQARTSAIQSQYTHAQSKAYYEAQMTAIGQGQASMPVSTMASTPLPGVGVPASSTGSLGGLPMAGPGAGASPASSAGSGNLQKQVASLQGQLTTTEQELKNTQARLVAERDEKAREVTSADRDDDPENPEEVI